MTNSRPLWRSSQSDNVSLPGSRIGGIDPLRAKIATKMPARQSGCRAGDS
jgi:hypothetical protein